jgi:hypothetical protein
LIMARCVAAFLQGQFRDVVLRRNVTYQALPVLEALEGMLIKSCLHCRVRKLVLDGSDVCLLKGGGQLVDLGRENLKVLACRNGPPNSIDLNIPRERFA